MSSETTVESLPRAIQGDGLDRIVALDGLRGIACLMVLLSHTQFIKELAKNFTQIADTGGLGVKAFMCFSGFFITRGLIHKPVEPGLGRAVMRFYVKRTARIFVVYYLCIAVVHIALGVPVAWTEVLYLTNYYPPEPASLSHVWSLSVEEQFYLVWPWLILPFRREHSRWIVVGVIVGSLMWAVHTATQMTGGPLARTLYFGTQYNAILFGIGGLMAYVEGTARKTPTVFRACAGGFLLTALVTAGCYLWALDRAALVGEWMLCTFLAASMVSAALLDSPVIARPLSYKPLVFVGSISYGVYLYHMPIFEYFQNVFAAWAATFVVAYVSYRLIEAPLSRWVRGKVEERKRPIVDGPG